MLLLCCSMDFTRLQLHSIDLMWCAFAASHLMTPQRRLLTALPGCVRCDIVNPVIPHYRRGQFLSHATKANASSSIINHQMHISLLHQADRLQAHKAQDARNNRGVRRRVAKAYTAMGHPTTRCGIRTIRL